MNNFLDNSQEVISVSEVNKRAKGLLEKEFSQTWIEGEISSFTAYSSGHWYFTLKDEKSALSCVMLSYENNKVLFEPKVGDHLILNGKISIYQPTGKYQLNVKHIELAGKGALLRAFEDLKEKLDSEGLFDEKIKKLMPLYPFNIGVVTSPDGAVFRDIINVLTRRSPLMTLTLIPTIVQGEKSAAKIVEAIKLASMRQEIDIVIIARGGGSIEDLWSFNTEIVARAISKCSKPIISAIGHETDFTISDFVADLRAATPSAAAEIVSEPHMIWSDLIKQRNKDLIMNIESSLVTKKISLKNLFKLMRHPGDRLREVSQSIDEKDIQLKKEVLSSFNLKNHLLDNLALRLINASPEKIILNKLSSLEISSNRVFAVINKILELAKSKLQTSTSTLDAVSPLAVISRGYSILTNKEGKIVQSIKDIKIGEKLSARIKNGLIDTKVIEKKSIEE